VGTFDYTVLTATIRNGHDCDLAAHGVLVIFLAFALAFCIKVPLWPLHTWLPDAHTEAPTAGSVILAGVLLKMGTYGLLRFNFGLFPNASRQLAPLNDTLAVIGIIYGALVAMVQPDVEAFGCLFISKPIWACGARIVIRLPNRACRERFIKC